MYSDNVQHATARRANDEFLRRLVGGELCRTEKCRLRGAGREASCTRQNEPYTRQNEPYTRQSEPYTRQSEPYTRQNEPCTRQSEPCTRQSEPCTRQSEPCTRPQPRGAVCNLQTGREEHSLPLCNQGDGCAVPTSHIHAPALAMVYCPVQGWKGLLDPMQALAHGSQFTALILPLETDKREGNCGRCQK